MALTKIDISSASKVTMENNYFCFYGVLIKEMLLKKECFLLVHSQVNHICV